MKPTAGQRRYLSRRICGLCDIRLYPKQCGAIFSPRCTDEFLADRQQRCLAEYKPRAGRAALSEAQDG